MPVNQTEGKYPGEFLASRAVGTQSVDNVIVIQQAAIVPGSMVMAIIAASGKWTPLNLAGADGSQNSAGILYATTDATAGDVKAVLVTRTCEINSGKLLWPAGITTNQIAAELVKLAAKGIVVRGPSV